MVYCNNGDQITRYISHIYPVSPPLPKEFFSAPEKKEKERTERNGWKGTDGKERTERNGRKGREGEEERRGCWRRGGRNEMDSWLSARRVIGEKSLDLVFVGGGRGDL